MDKLILASGSPRRRELISTLSIPFTVCKPDIDESQHPGENPLDYVMRLSREKAAAVAARLQEETGIVGTPIRVSASDSNGVRVLAADTVVILSADTMGIDEQGGILGKPADAADARRMLQQLRGRTHQVCTAITMIRVGAVGEPSLHTDLTRTGVTMRNYTDAEIEAYIATGDPFDKAGSYAIQHPVFKPVVQIEGCYTNVIGLPMCTLRQMLKRLESDNRNPSSECRCNEEYQALF